MKQQPPNNKIAHSPERALLKIRTEKNRALILKTVLLLFLFLLQLTVLSLLYGWVIHAFTGYIVLSLALSVCSAIAVLSSKRNDASKAVLVFVILVFFLIGFILYFFLDERIFFRRSKKRFRQVFTVASMPSGERIDLSSCDQRVAEDSRYLQSVGHFSVYGGRQQYFSSGGLLFDDLLEKLDQARKFIFIEFFIVADGILLDRFAQRLISKAKAGIDIRIIYDDMGSHSVFSAKMKTKLRVAGIKVKPFNRLLPFFHMGLNLRDHRKMVIIDGDIAYTGGANLADEYTNEARLYGYWKDAGIRTEGSAVNAFTKFFLRQWDFLTGMTSDYDRYYNVFAQTTQAVVIPYCSGPEYDRPVAKEVYLNIIAKSQERIYIMTPYLILDSSMMNLLINKAQAEIDVRIVLPGIPDKAVVWEATKNYAYELLEKGVKIYFMRNSFVHSKVILSDYCVVVGSANMDMRSFFQQFECGLYTDDEKVMNEVAADFEKTYAMSDLQALQKVSFWRRGLQKILKLVTPLF